MRLSIVSSGHALQELVAAPVVRERPFVILTSSQYLPIAKRRLAFLQKRNSAARDLLCVSNQSESAAVILRVAFSAAQAVGIFGLISMCA